MTYRATYGSTYGAGYGDTYGAGYGAPKMDIRGEVLFMQKKACPLFTCCRCYP